MDNNILNILFSSVNLGLTILVILLIIYWLFSMFLGLDSELDFDIDADIDADIDLEAGIESGNVDFDDVSNVELNKEDVVPNRKKPLKWWQIVLIYFNFVGLPFMFTFTTFVFGWWLITAVLTTITYSYNNLIGFALLLISIIPALFVTKAFTNPFKPIFKKLNRDGDVPIDYLGRKGVSLSNLKENKLGNAEVLVEGSPMSIYIKSLDGSPINYRDPILIIKEAEDKQYYYVKKYQD